jgi:2-aminoadipate transaminase
MNHSTEKNPRKMTDLPWTFPVADRLRGVQASPVREILSILSRGDVISFAGGIPDPELFAVEEIRAAFDHVLTHQASKALQYASTEGEPALREQAAARMSRQLPTTAEQIQITSGSQEGLYLIGQALLDSGDVVLVERPTYLAAVQAFALSGARMIGIPTDEHGVLPDELEQLIERYQPKFVYLIPTFQNPTGRCMPASRRRQVAEVLLRTGTALVEDDPYGDLRFSGEPVAPIATLPRMPAQTLLLNSMSKIMAPGLRVGWIRGDGPILRSIAIVKQAVGLQSPVTDQLAVARYLATNDIDQHIRRISAVYKTRRDAMHAELSGILPEGATTTNPDGGMFLWARLGNDINTSRLLPLAVEEGVAFVPGSAFYAHDPDHTTMRLSYVTNSRDVIAEGIQRLSRAIKTYNTTHQSPAISH